MSAFTLEDPVLRQARARAAAGAWRDVASMLALDAASPAHRPHRVMLYAEALIRCGEPQNARAFLTEAAPVFERAADRAVHRTALNLLGAASFAVGALDEAQTAWDQVLEMAQETEDALLVARATNNLGAIANLRGATHDALRLYNLAVPLYQRLGELRGLAETFHNVAMTYRDLGELTRSDEYEQRAAGYARDARWPRLAIMAQVGRAEVALRRGDYPLAAATALHAAAAAAGEHDDATRADALRCAGEARTRTGDHADARRLLDDARATAANAGQALMLAEVDLASAELESRTGDRERALNEGRAAAGAFEALGARAQHARAVDLLRGLNQIG